MKISLRIFLFLLIVGVAVGGFKYLQATKPEAVKPKARERIWQVEVVEARRETLAPQLSLYAEVVTDALVAPAAPAPAVVQQVNVQDGDAVRAGDLLIALDERDFEPAVLEARAAVSELQAQLEQLQRETAIDRQALKQERELLALTEAEVTRSSELKSRKLAAESALDAALSARERQRLAITTRERTLTASDSRRRQLQARLTQNQARLQRAELDQQRSRVVAPFDGIVASIDVAAGDRVQAGQKLLSVMDAQSLEVRGRIPYRYQSEILGALGEGAELSAVGRIDGGEVRLRLDRLSGQADPSGVDAYFSVTDGREHLRLGNLLTVQLSRPMQADVYRVPTSVVYGNDRAYVLRDGRMQGVDVQVVGRLEGGQTSELLIRAAGIQPGEPVIITQLPGAYSGLKVRLPGEGRKRADKSLAERPGA